MLILYELVTSKPQIWLISNCENITLKTLAHKMCMDFLELNQYASILKSIHMYIICAWIEVPKQFHITKTMGINLP